MQKIHAVTYEDDTNTIELTILDKVLDAVGNVTAINRVSCRNFSKEQKAEFLAQFVAGDGMQYIPPKATAAGW